MPEIRLVISLNRKKETTMKACLSTIDASHEKNKISVGNKIAMRPTAISILKPRPAKNKLGLE